VIHVRADLRILGRIRLMDTDGVTINPSTINAVNGTRSDSKAGYIDPMAPRSNLVILTNQQVTQVIFNGSTDASGNIIASGVRFQGSRGAAAYTVQANKEVILA
jgi:choline dehydrogenase